MNRAMKLLACGLLAGLSAAASTSVSTDAAAQYTLPKPTMTIRPTSIQSATLDKGSLSCSASVANFVVTLVGNSKLPSSGKITAVRFAGTNQVVSVGYSLAVNETKNILVPMSFQMNCADMAPPRFSIKLEPATGGWDNNYKDLSPTSVAYNDFAGNVYGGELGGSDPATANNAKLTSLRANGALSLGCGSANVAFAAALKGNTSAASAGSVQLTKRQSGLANVSATAAYNIAAGGSATVNVPSTWSLNCNEKLAKFDAMLVPTAGGNDGGYHSLMPTGVFYKTSTSNTNTAPP